MAPSRVRIPPSPLAQRPPRFCAHPRRGGRAVECGGLENRYPSLGGSRVQIPPPPLARPSLARKAQRSRSPQGISALSCVPRPGGLSTCSRPPTASTRSARPASPEPRTGSAPPTPSSLTTTVANPLDRSTATLADVACAYFATFVIASATR